MPLPNSDDLAKALAELGSLSACEEETPDEGFARLEEWTAELGCSERSTRRKITAGVKAGVFERKEYRVKLVDGRISKMAHWRWVPEEERNLLSPKA